MDFHFSFQGRAMKTPFFSLLITLLFFGLLSPLAQAGNESPDAGKAFATVWRLRGEVVTQAGNAAARRLQVGSVVRVGEVVRAAADAEAVLKTADAGLIAIRPGAEFVVERFSAEGKSDDRQILRLLTGSLRIVSGWIAWLNRRDHQVVTPTATIGIRGTDHEPYVLPPARATGSYAAGTYDKVNRGGTALTAGGGSVEIEPGRVGFARDSGRTRTRALLTLLLPVLLDHVPGFFVAGSFDAEVEKFSLQAAPFSRQQLAQRYPDSRLPAEDSERQPAAIAVPSAPDSPAGERLLACDGKAVAQRWLAALDAAIARREVKNILHLLAPEIVATATVRGAEGMQTLHFDRDALVQSMLSAMAGLKDYRQRRLSVQVRLPEGEAGQSCRQLQVTSLVIEEGRMNDRPYRFEAEETYRLERQGEGDEALWQAVRAETKQRF